MHAIRERENTYTVVGKGRHDIGAGEGDANELVMVDKYTQNRQMWLKGKIVKSGHDMHYKKTFIVPRMGGRKHRGRTRKEK